MGGYFLSTCQSIIVLLTAERFPTAWIFQGLPPLANDIFINKAMFFQDNVQYFDLSAPLSHSHFSSASCHAEEYSMDFLVPCIN